MEVRGGEPLGLGSLPDLPVSTCLYTQQSIYASHAEIPSPTHTYTQSNVDAEPQSLSQGVRPSHERGMGFSGHKELFGGYYLKVNEF